MSNGINYPTAMSKALEELTNVKIDKPNDLLGLSYVKEIIKNKYPITPISIKRSNDYHSNKIENNIISANLIRKLLQENKNIEQYIPTNTSHYLYKNLTINKAFELLKYKIINDSKYLREYLTIDEGIENRILKYIHKSNSWEDLVMNIKTKRYTYNKINRMLIHILLGIKKEDNTKEIYLRVLGFNEKGKLYLNKIKKQLELPLIIGYKPNISKILDLEFKSTSIYSIITKDQSLIEQEYKNKPIIK
jgi:predicted nucleotidyltransferase